jgi:hypothetical protein
MPVAVMVPLEADQVTAVFVVPETVPENCCCCPLCKLAAVGETVTAIVLGGGVEFGTVTVTTAVSDATTVELDLRREVEAVAVTLYVPADEGAV